MPARLCPTCQARYTSDDSFCPRDGTELVDPLAQTAPEARADAPDPREGEIIAERFVLKRRIGQGGMGVIYLAAHRRLSRQFAIKLLLPGLAHDDQAMARFLREARAASAVDHQNLLSIYDFGKTDRGEPFLVMEYVTGTTLYQALVESPSRTLQPSRVLDIAVQIAEALEHAHGRGVVHRDIKPENILLTERDGAPDWVKILDFGVARIVGQPPLTHSGEQSVGTPEYMAPEMVAAPAMVGFPVDLYALGVMLFEVLTGTPPFTGNLNQVLWDHQHTPPPPLSADLPQELCALVAQLLSKDPALRPTAAEAGARLAQARAQLPRGSLRSRLVMQTLILAGQQQAQPPTVLLQKGAPAGAPAGTALSPSLPAMLADIDQIEGEIDRASAVLSQEVGALGDQTWPKGWPEEAQALQRQLVALDEEEERIGLDLALLNDQLEEHRQLVQAQRDRLRRRIIELREQIQRPGTSPERRRALQQQLAQQEDGLLQIEQEEESANTDLFDRRGRLHAALHARREGRQRTLLKLARLQLSRSTISGPSRARVEEMVGRLEAALMMLAQRLGSAFTSVPALDLPRR
jgi:hypothetical protein